ALGYKDVDGDGVQEILLWSDHGNARDPTHMLSILTRDGTELTRQDDCRLDTPLWDKAGSLCPIVGDSMELVRGNGRTTDILVKGLLSDRTPKTYRYRLVAGHYVPRRVVAPKLKPARS